jgi:hypothetical protein
VSDTGQDTPVGREQGPAARSDEDRELAARLVAEASEKGLDLVGPDGVLTGLTKRVLEAGLEAELTEHLGYDKHAVEGRGGGNSRNGTRPKTVLTEVGPVKLDVPRDRDSSFAPQLVKKRQRRLHGVDEMIISLTAKGLTTGEAQAQLAEVYGSDVRARTGFFCREDGSGLDPDWVSAQFRKLCETAGVRRLRLHDTRHAMATLMLAAGIRVEVVNKRLGHARISVTYDMYTHPDDEQQRKAADAFGRLLADGGET